MTVTGPNWPSTRALREALTTVDTPRVLHWGRSPCDKFEAIQNWATSDIPTIDCLTIPVPGWWGRRRRHTQGRDIDRTGRQARDFWVKPIISEAELRVHVWAGRAFRTGVKVLTRDTLDPFDAYPIRSSRLGWQVKYTQSLLDAHSTSLNRSRARDMAVQAAAVLGVDGGAIDILVGTDGQLYCLELNTAPALGPLTLAAYVHELTEWAEEFNNETEADNEDVI